MSKITQELTKLVSQLSPHHIAWALIILFLMLLLVLGLVVGGSIAVYRADDPFTLFGLQFGPVHTGKSPFEQAIIITDKECSTLGSGWAPYPAMAGRFPVSAGQNTDISGTIKTFNVGQEDTDGEYAHTLSIEEMPAHTHMQDGSRTHNRSCSGGCSSPLGGENDQTGSAGGNQSHNNLPPYFVVNFCKKTGN